MCTFWPSARPPAGDRPVKVWCSKTPVNAAPAFCRSPRAARLRLPRRGDSTVRTPISRISALLATLALALFGAGCGGSAKKADAGGPSVPALRFAGVDLEYALERIATEAGLVIALDEIMPKDQSPDLRLIRVDVDLPAGSLEQVMNTLREKIGGFDYRIYPGVLYVRSSLLIDQKTSL